jgi:hypothetical protein
VITNELVREPATRLRFDRTVDRNLVHKSALAEVLLTDLAAIDERRYLAGAQLPAFHAYFTDQPRHPAHLDSLAVLEATRQAVTYGAHTHLGFPPETTFMVGGWTLRITDPDALDLAGRPGELVVDTVADERPVRGGRARHLTLTSELYLAGTPLGTATMEGACVPAAQYAVLRTMQRGTEPPTVVSYDEPATVVPAVPEAVGRRNPANVVVGTGTEPAGSFLYTGAYRNPSMFDHAYDHVPAMVLTEAARQALVLTRPGDAADRVVDLRGRFTRFTELDEPTAISVAQSGLDGAAEVSFRQAGELLAEIAVTLG